jgi:hypothetical protein
LSAGARTRGPIATSHSPLPKLCRKGAPLWTDKNRAKYNRGQLRYPSDLTDDERFDAGKLIKGKKRHILVDMQGLLLHAIVHSAGIHDRDGGIWLLATLSGQFPFLAKLFVDTAYAGSIFHTALAKVSPNLKTEVKTLRSCQRVRAITQAVAADWPRIGRTSIATLSPFSNSLPSASCYESYAILDKVPGRTLRM